MIEPIGKSVQRVEDNKFLKGLGEYTDDISFLEIAHMYIIRSVHPAGIIKKICYCYIYTTYFSSVIPNPSLSEHVHLLSTPSNFALFIYQAYQWYKHDAIPFVKIQQYIIIVLLVLYVFNIYKINI